MAKEVSEKTVSKLFNQFVGMNDKIKISMDAERLLKAKPRKL